MSYITWHYYGFGICTDAIQTKDVERLQALLAKAPELEKEIQKWLTECGIEDPVWDGYMEYDQDYSLGLATIMKEVILEAEGIEMTACDSYDAGRFLIYEPRYPWKMKPLEMQLTEDKLKALFSRYVSILTDTPIEVDYQALANGG